MALQFYEKVEILTCPEFPDRVGKFGYILGKSYVDEPHGNDPEPTEVLGYGVFFEDVEKVYSFGPHEVRGTGEVAERSRFYPD